MTLIPRVARILSIATTYSIFCIGMFSTAHAQNAPKKISDPTLIQQMAGIWNVQQRMWPGVGAEAVNLPPAAARRRLMAGGFLEEVMEPVQITGAAPQLLISYEYDQSQIDGPPFSVNEDEVRRHYGAAYQLESVESKEVAGGLKGKVASTENAWFLQKANR